MDAASIGRLVRGAVEVARDAGTTAAGVGAVTVGGGAIGASPWLLGLAQAAVVVGGVLFGIDRREKRRAAEVAELRGEVSTLAGRVKHLRCLDGTPVPLPCPKDE